MSRLASYWLGLACCIGCAGSAPMPMVQVPLLRRAGQVEAGLLVAPASEQPEIGGTVRAAATEHMRLGASISGATRRDRGDVPARGSEDEGTPRLFTDGFLGAEWGGFLVRYGVLAGAGYGLRRQSTRRCVASDPVVPCMPLEALRLHDASFVRAYGQLHIALAPPGPLMTSFAVRVPVVVDLPDQGLARETALDTEFALTQTVQLRYLRVDLQPHWSSIRGFAFHVAFLFRFSPPARGRQARSRRDELFGDL